MCNAPVLPYLAIQTGEHYNGVVAAFGISVDARGFMRDQREVFGTEMVIGMCGFVTNLDDRSPLREVQNAERQMMGIAPRAA